MHRHLVAAVCAVVVVTGGFRLKAETTGVEGGKAETTGVEGGKAETTGVEGGKAETTGVEGGKAETTGLEKGRAVDAEQGAPAAQHAREVSRLLIRGAMIIPGTGVPAYGPVDLLLEGGLIARIGNAASERWPAADTVIDATGKWVMPGIVNTHMHWHEERVGPIPIQYERNLYLASGVTTAREVGGDFAKAKQWREESAGHKIIAPRILLYPMLVDMLDRGQAYNGSPAEIQALVKKAKDGGADGLKLIGPMDRDQAAAAISTAKSLNLPTTVHIAVGEATARDYVDLGVNCIEHFYGIPDASFDGLQNFPPETNLYNEIHRFGRAGELYTQNNLNKEKLSKLLDDMVARGVAWSPTMSTYEAARDLIRAQNLPWYRTTCTRRSRPT